MVSSPSLTIGRVRAVAPASAAVTARLAIDALLADLASTSPGLPPQSVLLLRNLTLGVPRSALMRTPDAGLRERFSSAANHALRDAARRATRPARDAVTGSELAVLFADDAELLACLARAATRGELDRWWWRALLGGHYPDWTDAFVARPEAVPAALRWLARIGLESFVRQALRRQPALRALLDDAVSARRIVREPSSVNGNEPATELPSGEPMALPQARVHDETVHGDRHEVSGTGETTRSSALAPAVSAGAGQREARQLSLANAVEQKPNPPQSVVVTSIVAHERSLSRALSLHSESLTAPRQSPMSVVSVDPRATPGNPFVLDHSAEVASELERPQLAFAASVRREASSDQKSFSDVLAYSRESESLGALIERACRQLLEPQRTSRKQAGESAHAVVATLLESGATAAPRDEALLNGAELDSEPSPEKPIHTDFGGVFFLVNVFLAQGLYPDFTRPRDPGFPVPLWRLLALVARRLLGRKLRGDPLFALLLALEDGPVTESLELDAHWAPPEPPRVRKGDPLERWLTGFVCWLRPALSEALAWPVREVASRLLSAKARVWVTPGAVVCVLPLATHPIETRLAGLDRDPGFLPSAGRSLTFVFE